MSKSIAEINNFLQYRLRQMQLSEVSVKEAARWLDEAGYLRDSRSSPGFPLRRLIQSDKIVGAYKQKNYFWFIRRVDGYRELISPRHLQKLLGAKNIQSVYKKVKLHKIPHVRLQNGQLIFYRDEVVRWLLNQHYPLQLEQARAMDLLEEETILSISEEEQTNQSKKME